MNFLKRLFTSASTSGDPREILKRATSLKKEGKIDEAIVKLKEAYAIIPKTGMSWDVQTFLRLPQYLALAGKNDEAWREFNNLLLGYPTQLRNREVLPMNHSVIYGKMRIFLQGEKKYNKAVLFEMFSLLCWCQGLSLQKRKKELRECSSEEAVDSKLKNTLKKAGLVKNSKIYRDIVLGEMKHLPDINLARVSEKFTSANQSSHTTPASAPR